MNVTAISIAWLILATPVIHDDHDVDKIVWHNARTGKKEIGKAGTWGTPMSFIEPPTERPLADQCNTVYLDRWLAVCPIVAPQELNRRWDWIAPPPLVKCRVNTEPKSQYGYFCKEGNDSVAGFQGAWIPERRP